MSITHGFVHGPADRGTLDIAWPCVFVLVLCAWTTQDGGIDETRGRAWARKSISTCLMIIAPDISLAIALYGFLKARRVVAAYNRRHRESRWTMVEGFYAEMGGFNLEGRSLTWLEVVRLIKEDFIAPKSYAKDIGDRTKRNALWTFVVYAQSLWLIAQCIARRVEHLPLSTLELGTVGHVAVACIICVVSWYKTSVVVIPISICIRAGKSRKDAEDVLRSIDDSDATKRPDIEMAASATLPEKPLKTLGEPTSQGVHDSTGRWDHLQVPFAQITCMAVCIGFGLWHCTAWNNVFPTHIEQHLWRICTVLSAIPSIPLLVALVFLAPSRRHHGLIMSTTRTTFYVCLPGISRIPISARAAEENT